MMYGSLYTRICLSFVLWLELVISSVYTLQDSITECSFSRVVPGFLLMFLLSFESPPSVLGSWSPFLSYTAAKAG